MPKGSIYTFIFGLISVSALMAQQSDWCEEQGRYTDGYCTPGCPTPDPECPVSSSSLSSSFLSSSYNYDWCEEQGRYEDGQCTQGCPTPDPECGNSSEDPSSSSVSSSISSSEETSPVQARLHLADNIRMINRTLILRIVVSSYMHVALYDYLGTELEVLHNGQMSAGYHSLDIQSKLQTGKYFLRIRTHSGAQTLPLHLNGSE